MRRLLHRVEVVDIADSLYVGQNAGADHQSEQVNRHENSGAGTESDKESRWIGIAVVQLHFYHSHLERKRTGNTTLYASVMCDMTDSPTEEQQDGFGESVTIANPESSADVRLEAFSLARLRYSFLQDSACSECSFRLMLCLLSGDWTSSTGVVTLLLLRDATQTSVQHANSTRLQNIYPRQLTELRKLFSPLQSRVCMHLILPTSLCAPKTTSAAERTASFVSVQ